MTPPTPTSAGLDTHRRWAPVAPIAISAAAVTAAVAGALVMGRPGDLGDFAGLLVYLAGMAGLVYATYRAVWDRARHFATLGVPEEWTRALPRSMRDTDLRRWDATIRGMRHPIPEERDTVLVAARARAEGLLSIEIPAGLTVLGFVAMVLLAVRLPSAMPHYVGRGYLMPVVLVLLVVRFELIGARARAYLDRFGSAPAAP